MADEPPSATGDAAAHWKQVVEDLVEQADMSLLELVEGQKPLADMLDLDPFGLDDTVEMAAVSTIRRFAAALTEIAEGAPNPTAIAKDALG